MFDTREEKCHGIIHAAAAAAGAVGAGLAQIPLADNIPITTIQVGMITSIAKVFDIDLAEGAAKGLLAGFAANLIGRNVVGLAFGWVPGVGNAIKATTAAGLTETIGWAAVKHFENLEEDKKTSFKHGTQAGEEKAKEKFANILNGLKDSNYFFIALFRLCYYINKLMPESKEKLKKLLMDEISNFNSCSEKDIRVMECLRILN